MIELEKKWVLKEKPDFQKAGFEFIKAEQYLQGYINSEERLRRIRKPGSKVKTYEYFKKVNTAVGTSVEDKKELTEAEYTKLHKKVKTELLKVREYWYDETTKLYYEFDHLKFDKPKVDIYLLEIEFQDFFTTIEEVDDNYQLPEFVDDVTLADVTGNKRYSNYSLSI